MGRGGNRVNPTSPFSLNMSNSNRVEDEVAADGAMVEDAGVDVAGEEGEKTTESASRRSRRGMRGWSGITIVF
jgi:hypothetical protein